MLTHTSVHAYMYNDVCIHGGTFTCICVLHVSPCSYKKYNCMCICTSTCTLNKMFICKRYPLSTSRQQSLPPFFVPSSTLLFFPHSLSALLSFPPSHIYMHVSCHVPLHLLAMFLLSCLGLHLLYLNGVRLSAAHVELVIAHTQG